MHINTRLFFPLWQLFPVRVEHEVGTAAWLAGTLAAPSVQGHRLPPPQELCPYQSLFSKASCSWQSEGLFGQSFSVALPVQAFRGHPCLPGVLLYCSECQAHRRAPWLGSYSVDQHISHLKKHPWVGSYFVVQCVRHLMGQPLYCSAANAASCQCWGERL